MYTSTVHKAAAGLYRHEVGCVFSFCEKVYSMDFILKNINIRNLQADTLSTMKRLHLFS